MTDWDAEAANKTCCDLWRFFEAREWDKARALLSDDLEVYWPQSREKIVGPEKFIEVNRRYPGAHKITIISSMCQYDRWDKEFAVSTQVKIESKMPDGKEMTLYAASFFELDRDGYIKGATEYWADLYDPPEWRKDLVERY